jgi:type III secretion protein Q
MNCRTNAFPVQALHALLPAVEPSTLALHNRLHGPRAPLAAQCNGQAVTLTVTAAPQQAAGELLSVWLSGAHLQGRLVLPTRLLERVLADAAVFAVFDSLAIPAQAIVLEQALLQLLEPLEAVLEEPLSVDVPSEPALPLPLAFGMAVSFADGETLTLGIELSAAAAQRVADLLDRCLARQPQALPGLVFNLPLQAGWQVLTLSEARSLNPGDVLMLEVPADADVYVALAGNRGARARREKDGIRLVEALNCSEPITEYAMSQTPLESGQDASLGDVPLTVVCQVGSVQLSLAEVQQLAEGSVLALPDGGSDCVELMVNGRSVGRGELVKIGDGLGVRLTRFARL